MRAFFHGAIALLLACNYFAFQVELFEDEYEENHPVPHSTCSFTHPSLTWESFDKDNALQAFVVHVELQVQLVNILPAPAIRRVVEAPPSHPVRDKSPPDASTLHVVAG